jgi:myo-inositol catabolism protein IolC
MEPSEIFELIVKADERLKYAHEDNAGLRTQQARDLLVQARDAAREIGNEVLVKQAETRLADLDAGAS